MSTPLSASGLSEGVPLANNRQDFPRSAIFTHKAEAAASRTHGDTSTNTCAKSNARAVSGSLCVKRTLRKKA
eukprot:12282917-Alexandrium_andersonii.AAC.1